jgi:hypothetical protein
MRNNSLTRKVRRAYSQDQLARICTLPEHEFGRAFGMETISTGKQRVYRPFTPAEDYCHFKDNGSRVLAVAHLDTVVRPERRTPHFRKTARGPLITSGALDDRLGAYVILRLLPAMGVTCDWLLTVGEESGQSTAADFTPGKDYDWIIEFDRGGTDVVMYQFDDRASRDAVEAAGATMGHGSFSDIASLEHLGVKAFNWGVGYQGDYHSEHGYAYLNDTFGMVAKYLRFHEQNAGVTMPHDPRTAYYADDYEDGYADDYEDCESCGEENAVDPATRYCTSCGICADCGATDPDVAQRWDDPDVDVCTCYTPRYVREEAASARERNDEGRQFTMTYEEYMARRPDASAPPAQPAALAILPGRTRTGA